MTGRPLRRARPSAAWLPRWRPGRSRTLLPQGAASPPALCARRVRAHAICFGYRDLAGDGTLTRQRSLLSGQWRPYGTLVLPVCVSAVRGPPRVPQRAASPPSPTVPPVGGWSRRGTGWLVTAVVQLVARAALMMTWVTAAGLEIRDRWPALTSVMRAAAGSYVGCIAGRCPVLRTSTGWPPPVSPTRRSPPPRRQLRECIGDHPRR